jgi:hypothetical protein
MVRPLRLLLPLPVVAALALSACGQTSTTTVPSDLKGTQRDVAERVKDLSDAGRKRDAKKICAELLAPAVVQRIEAASKRPCRDVLHDALGDADSFDLKVKRVTVDGSHATAVVESDAGRRDTTDTLGFVKVGGVWKVLGLGGEGKPLQP